MGLILLSDEMMIGKNHHSMGHKLIAGIPQNQLGNCPNGKLKEFWDDRWDKNRQVAVIEPNTVFWLYFWAETGQGDPDTQEKTRRTRDAARRVFCQIFCVCYKDGCCNNLFERFKCALYSVGRDMRLDFGTNNSGNAKDRDDLRPNICDDHCRDVFKRILEKPCMSC